MIHLPQSKQSILPNHAQHSLQKLKLLTAAKQISRRQAVKCILTVGYAYAVCHIYGNIWKQRGFLRAEWHTSNAWSSHLNTNSSIHLSSVSAIIKCAAHQQSSSLIAKSNSLADEAAKQAETGTCVGRLKAAENCEPLTTLPSLIAAQKEADIRTVSVVKTW